MLEVFVVEDSLVICENLTALLEELAGVKVVGTAEDEHRATTWLSDDGNRCDLVIVDIFLKGGSGLGVLRAAHARRSPVSLVVLSNYATADMRFKCLELGASAVFDKSNEIEALLLHCARLTDARLQATPSGACSCATGACRHGSQG